MILSRRSLLGSLIGAAVAAVTAAFRRSGSPPRWVALPAGNGESQSAPIEVFETDDWIDEVAWQADWVDEHLADFEVTSEEYAAQCSKAFAEYTDSVIMADWQRDLLREVESQSYFHRFINGM